jgi:NADPH-dependent 2,4-dienoyl-CoA reductase/sulfur reductase-like enzyme
MDAYEYIIVGGGLAGGKAVEGIRELDKEKSIAVITEEPRRPYQRPPLSKGYLTGKQDEEKVYVAEAGRYEKPGIELMTSTRVTAVDPEAHTVTLDDGRTLKYSKLLLATGGNAKRLPIEGNDLEGVFTLRTVEDSDAIREAAGPGKQALILGGSFIGSEVGAGLTMLGSEVTMVFPEERLLERIAPRELSEYLHQVYSGRNVRILPGTVPDRFLGGTHIERAELSNGAIPNADMAVMGVGITLNTELADEAGLDLREEDNAVIVNEQLQTSDPDIYAAGDIAAWPGAHFDKRLRVEHWDVARAQGLQAGRNMAGAGEIYDVLPYFFSDLFDLSFEVWGDLSTWDQTVTRGTLEDRTVAFYYFRDGRLVGVLAMGRPEEEREPMQTLVKKRPKYDQVAEPLKDGSTNLQELAEGL